MKNYLKGRRLGKINCDNCGIECDKPQSEINRNHKLNRNLFCSRNCCGQFNIFKNLGDKRKIGYTHNNGGSRRDEWSPFRACLRSVNKRYKDVGISMEDIRDQWIKQNGKCPYSGVKLTLEKHGDPIYQASLDRIDSSIGYLKDNIQFVSTPINYMKNTMSHDNTIKLCRIITDYHNSLSLVENTRLELVSPNASSL